MMKKVAIILSNSPHGHAKGREALDAALAMSDINHISVFFINDGIFHLLANQDPKQILMRDYIATFKMLELYDIEDVYVCQKSLDERNLSGILFSMEAKKIDTQTLNSLLAKQDVILNF